MISTTSISNFFYIKDVTVWQGALLSSIFIPLFFFIFTKVRKWYSNTRPIRSLLKGCIDSNLEILVFLSQLTALDNNDRKNPRQKYAAFYPNPLPTDRNNFGINGYHNIDPVWSESDGRCAADIFNILGRSGKTENIRIADIIKDWGNHGNPIFGVGFNPKTRDIINECEFINFGGYNEEYLAIDGHDLQLNSLSPNDAGIVQKTFIRNTSTPVFILAGLGTMGTEVSGYFMSQNCIQLGKLYGNKSFCILLKTDITKGRNYYEVKAMYPKPSITRCLFYPLTYYMWYKKNIFPKN